VKDRFTGERVAPVRTIGLDVYERPGSASSDTTEELVHLMPAIAAVAGGAPCSAPMAPGAVPQSSSSSSQFLHQPPGDHHSNATHGPIPSSGTAASSSSSSLSKSLAALESYLIGPDPVHGLPRGTPESHLHDAETIVASYMRSHPSLSKPSAEDIALQSLAK